MVCAIKTGKKGREEKKEVRTYERSRGKFGGRSRVKLGSGAAEGSEFVPVIAAGEDSAQGEDNEKEESSAERKG